MTYLHDYLNCINKSGCFLLPSLYKKQWGDPQQIKSQNLLLFSVAMMIHVLLFEVSWQFTALAFLILILIYILHFYLFLHFVYIQSEWSCKSYHCSGVMGMLTLAFGWPWLSDELYYGLVFETIKAYYMYW